MGLSWRLVAGCCLLLALPLWLFGSQMSKSEMYGTYYNEPLDNNEAPYPCIILELNRDGTFRQAAYYGARKVATLQGTYQARNRGLKFSEFIFYVYQTDSKNHPSSRAFIQGWGSWQVGIQRWFGDISIPSGNDEDNYYVKPRGHRCTVLP